MRVINRTASNLVRLNPLGFASFSLSGDVLPLNRWKGSKETRLWKVKPQIKSEQKTVDPDYKIQEVCICTRNP